MKNVSGFRGLIRGKFNGVRPWCKATGKVSIVVLVCQVRVLHKNFTPLSLVLWGQSLSALMVAK